LKIHFHITISTAMPKFPKSPQNSKLHVVLILWMCNKTCPYQPPWSGHLSDIPWKAKITTLLNVSLSSPLWQFSYISHRPKYSPQHLPLKHHTFKRTGPEDSLLYKIKSTVTTTHSKADTA
jgi:hypothetical protein